MRFYILVFVFIGSVNILLTGQNNTARGSAIPLLVRFDGTTQEFGGNVSPGYRNMVFSLFANESGGNALWTEMQTVEVNGEGQFTVLLGLASQGGVPAWTTLARIEQAR